MLVFFKVEDCFDARFPPGQERAVWHTLEQKEHSVASAARAGWRFKKQQERLESCGVQRERRRCVGDTQTSGS